MKKTNQSYKMSKPLKRVLALAKFKSDAHKYSFKAVMIDAEISSRNQPSKQQDTNKQ